MGWWPLGRQRGTPAAAAPPAVQPGVLAATGPSDGAWRDLPAVQRTLGTPIEPIAIHDRFRGSLSAYADPSLLAPLTHGVDPAVGGLVTGLAAPGVPQPYGGGLDLPVAPRPQPSRPSATVQRRVDWTGSADLTTVPWELPDHSPESEVTAPVAPADAPTVPTVPSAVLLPDSSAESSADSSADSSVDAPTAPVPPAIPTHDDAPLVGTSDPKVLGESIGTPTQVVGGTAPQSPAASAPVVSRLAVPERLSPTGSAVDAGLLGVQSETGRPPLPPSPSVQRSVVTDLPTVRPTSTRAEPAAREVGATDGPAPVVQRDHSSVIPAARPPMPVVSRVVGEAAPRCPVTSVPPKDASDVPTLGVRNLTATPIAPPLTRAAVEPVVQRLEFPALATVPPPKTSDVVRGVATPKQPNPESAVRETLVAELSASELPVPDASTPDLTTGTVPVGPGPEVPAPLSPSAGVVVSRLPDSVSPIVSRLEAGTPTRPDRSPAAAPVATGDRPVVVQRSVSTRVGAAEVAPPMPSVADHGAAEQPSSHSGGADLAPPDGPAVAAETWVNESLADAPSSHLASVPVGGSASGVAVQRTPGYAPTRSTISIGPSIPVQRTPAGSPGGGWSGGGSPVRQAAPATMEVAHSGVSFASMFAGPHAPETGPAARTGSAAETGSAVEDGFTSVQLQPADAPPPPEVAEPPAVQTAPATTAAPPPAGTPGADLDEMARRLYEPLAARLRAELWLDRERAGALG